MMLRVLLIAAALPFAIRAADDGVSPALALVQQAAVKLGGGDAAGFLSVFDPSMPNAKALRALVEKLAAYGDVQSAIEAKAESGEARERSLQLVWRLRISEREASKAVTLREANVTCRIAERDGARHIVAFQPVDLFAVPDVEGAWNVLDSAAAALSNGNTVEFLSYFAPSMAGYDELRAGVSALAAENEVQSSIDLTANEGSDTDRTLEVDWTLAVASSDSGIQIASRHRHVKCRIELRDKRWRITAVDPVDFFKPA